MYSLLYEVSKSIDQPPSPTGPKSCDYYLVVVKLNKILLLTILPNPALQIVSLHQAPRLFLLLHLLHELHFLPLHT